jgi:uncharacterized membrane protein
MIGQFHDDRFTASVYIGTVLAANVFLLAMILIVRADPGLAKDGESVSERQRLAAVVVTGILAVALVLAAAVPRVGYFALLLLMLSYPILWIWGRLRPAETSA